ncbi:cilia- and flagella-associated protein 99-like [Dendronephthya gigantea]|uniref:cilia- and flagella-associated protein 99-like n=1 Tax=Dendronephthya gigantea TaxID=151771 RepID=UPI00106C9D86|nr:cilia- and flagella-associated protein 99-like [Dendronephthya gigantea]
MSSVRLLMKYSSEVLDTYNSSTHGVEEHVENWLKKNTVTDENTRVFVIEVFSGCVRHESITKVVVDAYYVKDGKNCLRTDKNLYTVLCYLVLFRLEELGVGYLRKLVATQDVNKMFRFFKFFLDEKNIKTWMADEWCKLYDHSYVETTLVSTLLSWLPELHDVILLRLEEKITSRQVPERQRKPKTDMKPFKLTQPRPRSIPVPEKIPKLKPSKPVPQSTYATPSVNSKLEEARSKNRRKAESNLITANASQFQCANSQKSGKTQRKMYEIQAEKESKLRFDSAKANPAPSFIHDNLPIKLNAATIMREGQLYQKREQDEIKKLMELEKGGKDATDFYRWQEDMRKKDMEEQLADIERRRLEGMLSYEEAIMARQNLIRENQSKVAEIKEETREMIKEYLEKKFKEEQDMRRLVEETMQGHQNTKESRKRLQNYKQKLVQEVNKESREIMKRALEEAEEEMRQKVSLIAKIKAIESVPVIRFKYVDLTETSGAGLLNEMSIAELRERLSLLKTAEEEELEKKRDDILRSKVEKDEMLMKTLAKISKCREEQENEAMVRQQKKRKAVKPEVNDPKVEELRQKLEQRRAERESITRHSSTTNKRCTFQQQEILRQEKTRLENMKWTGLEKRHENTARLKSRGLLTQ